MRYIHPPANPYNGYTNDENDERYSRRSHYPDQSYYGHSLPRPLYRETEEEREAREHYEFGARWGVPLPYYAPDSYQRAHYDVDYDPYTMYEKAHSESRPHWTDDDEGYTLDFKGQPREIYRPKDKRRKGSYRDDREERRR